MSNVVEYYDKYNEDIRYHNRVCREPSGLGYNSHGLYICKKGRGDNK